MYERVVGTRPADMKLTDRVLTWATLWEKRERCLDFKYRAEARKNGNGGEQ